MCGICGYIGDTGCDRAQIRRMADRMAHRGPDSSGYFEEPGIHMGFRRLAIIDLQSGNQPVYNEDRSLVLTFNGEIYNYRELRKILLARGHFFLYRIRFRGAGPRLRRVGREHAPETSGDVCLLHL